jgi:hypothetical protein
MLHNAPSMRQIVNFSKASGWDSMSEASGEAATGGDKFRWFTSITAVVAFVISLYTFFSANIREVDDFQISLEGTTTSQNDHLNNVTFDFISGLNATFINTGTRPVAVERVGLIVSDNKTNTGDNEKDCPVSALEYAIDIDPFVVKSQELEIRSLKKLRRQTFQQFEATDGAAIIKFADPTANTRHLSICVSLAFIAPEHPPQSRLIKIFSGDWPSSAEFSPGPDQRYIFEGAPPLTLLRETSYSFFKNTKSKSD